MTNSVKVAAVSVELRERTGNTSAGSQGFKPGASGSNVLCLPWSLKINIFF